MQVTLYSDYALRVLVYLALKGDDLSTIQEIADQYQISKNHLMKVVNHLSQSGYITSKRGVGGGIKLARPADEIGIGAVLRETEDDLHVVECFDVAKPGCRINGVCSLKGMFGEALEAFLAVLDKYTLADVSDPATKLLERLKLNV